MENGEKEKALSAVGSGIGSINSKLEMIERAVDGKYLLEDKIQVVEGKLKEKLIELSSNVATVKVLIEGLIKAQRELLDLEYKKEVSNGY